MRHISIVLLLIISNFLFCQNLILPPCCTICKNYDDKEQRIDYDFDGNNIVDFAAIFENKTTSSKIAIIYFGTNSFFPGHYWFFDWDMTYNLFEYKEDVLILTSGSCEGRCSYALHLKLIPGEKNFRLIEYTEESLGNNTDKPYIKTVNLISGQYEMNKEKYFLKPEIITLFNINDKLIYLGLLGSDHYPK